MLEPIKYSKEDIKTISGKLNEESFTHTSWGDEDLSLIKESIKTHYHSVQQGTCPYCQRKINSLHGRNWDIEHIIPRSTVPNFMFEPHNLCMSCVECNSEKSNKLVTSSKAKKKYPSDSNQFFIIHPHFDVYEEHLLVIEAGLFYYPLKAKGRKTIEVCGLNRFYTFAGFGGNVDVFTMIQALTTAASSVDDEKVREEILAQITALAINGMVKSKRNSGKTI
ncbi:HNH endonuclease domain-containing protein [Vibrio vulnificus]|uniref:HNH endonuclease domain-containing protein n=1 Tax=Vibrio vulnificus TaxID=672 RepID=UPI004057DA02